MGGSFDSHFRGPSQWRASLLVLQLVRFLSPKTARELTSRSIVSHRSSAPCASQHLWERSRQFTLLREVRKSMNHMLLHANNGSGQYHWAAGLSPAWCRTFLSYITGWVSIGGQIVFTASAAFAAGLQFQSCITINHIDYQPERWQGMLFYWAVLLYAFAINVWGMRLMPFMNLVSGISPTCSSFCTSS